MLVRPNEHCSMAVRPRVGTYNCATAASNDRLESVLTSFRRVGVSMIVLQGTRRKLIDNARGFDEIMIANFFVISFGTLMLNESDAHSGVAVALDLNVFNISDIVSIIIPNKRRLWGRLGFMRIKRNVFDVFPFVCYLPPSISRDWLERSPST